MHKDYRYFPEPDLPRLVLTDKYIADIKKQLPESPEQKKQRYQKEFGLPAYDTAVLVDKDYEVSRYFDLVMQHCGDAKLASKLGKQMKY